MLHGSFLVSYLPYSLTHSLIQPLYSPYTFYLEAILKHKIGIWKVIRGLLDPVVAAKVDFTRNIEGLEKYIARENILSAYGGGDDWVYTYIEPSADEDARITQDGSCYAQREEILAELPGSDAGVDPPRRSPGRARGGGDPGAAAYQRGRGAVVELLETRPVCAVADGAGPDRGYWGGGRD